MGAPHNNECLAAPDGIGQFAAMQLTIIPDFAERYIRRCCSRGSWVIADAEDDRDRRGSSFGRQCGHVALP